MLCLPGSPAAGWKAWRPEIVGQVAFPPTLHTLVCVVCVSMCVYLVCVPACWLDFSICHFGQGVAELAGG
jgi:hypothetical protein